MSPRILIVEDEHALMELLRYNFEKSGYAVEVLGNGDQADARLKETVPDVLLLDWVLPGLSGIELCRRLRQSSATKHLPIVMLTARGDELDKVRGFETGADDYVVKPFSVHELLARVAALLRRMSARVGADTLTVGDIELNRSAMAVLRQGETVHLGLTDYRLLEFFMQSPGRVFTRRQLLDGVWGDDVYVDERTVDVHIGRLRKALLGRLAIRSHPHGARRRLQLRGLLSALRSISADSVTMLLRASSRVGAGWRVARAHPDRMRKYCLGLLRLELNPRVVRRAVAARWSGHDAPSSPSEIEASLAAASVPPRWHAVVRLVPARQPAVTSLQSESYFSRGHDRTLGRAARGLGFRPRARAIFISDVHLGTRSAQADRLLDFLRHCEADIIYLVGDIVDFWKVRRGPHWPQPHNDVVQKLLRQARKGVRLVLVPGNHDEALARLCRPALRRHRNPPRHRAHDGEGASLLRDCMATSSTSSCARRVGSPSSATMATNSRCGSTIRSIGAGVTSVWATGRCPRT